MINLAFKVYCECTQGTPPFMSMGLLDVLEESGDYMHTAVDDIESFVWVLLWAVLEKLDEISSLSAIERRLFTILHSSDIKDLQRRASFSVHLVANEDLCSPGFSVFSDLLLTWLNLASQFRLELIKKKKNHPLPRQYYQGVYEKYLKVGFEAVERMDEDWNYALSQKLTPA
ncbi:MAG TPA: hypothetical protein VGO47_07680 [Chlamydiales bacterium]|nr:hypothetical protein [Chlamydiales bacterium]